MCLQYWRSAGRPAKRLLLTWRGGYHGDTFMAMSVCDPEGGMHAMWDGVVTRQLFAPAPPWPVDPGYAATLAGLIAEHADELAAVIVEPVVQRLFQEIEAAGGAAAALEQGRFQMQVAATRAERLKAVARRKDALTGVSDYADLGELPVKVLDVARAAVAPVPAKQTFEKFPQLRLAEPFEALRDASDRMLARTGARPKVFLANLGKLSDFTTRATFANSFYGAGGIEAITNDGFKDQAEMISAFKASGARLACLCSSDAIYANEAAAAAKALGTAGAIVQLAGRAGENEANWNQAGVQAFIYAGCDAVATLKAAHDILGVK